MSSNNIKIAPGAIVCEESKLRGDITIGTNTIIHPCAIIIAECGPIVIGDNCLIEEQVQIINKVPFDRNAENQEHVLLIGSNNVFEVNCRIEAAKIGNNNVFGSKSFIGNSTQIPNGCHIGAGCQVLDGRILANNTVMFGENCCTRVAMNPPQPPVLQMDILGKLLPNYHYIKKGHKK